MKKVDYVLGFALSLSLGLLANSAFANHHMGQMTEPTKEQRVKMAESHAKMSECLKSDKPAGDCHKDMMETCAADKDMACPMMGGGHAMGKGHMKGHGKMRAEAKKGADSKKTEEAEKK